MGAKFVEGEDFWALLEKELPAVPVHLKLLCHLQKIDSPDVLSTVTKSDIMNDFQAFMRSSGYSSHIPEAEGVSVYYNNQNPKEFVFTDDDIHIFENIQQYILEKGIDYFKIPPASDKVSKWKTSTFMQMLKLSFSLLFQRKPTGHRFNYTPLPMICSYIFLLGGGILYKFLSANLPIPSISAIRKFVYKESDPVVEGELRVDGLSNFLEKRNLPRTIWLSADATGMNGKVQYDQHSNTLVGLVLPLNINSMPVPYSFKVKSAEDIKCHIDSNERASFLHVFMAQSLDKDAPPYCLLVFGTRSKMTHEDVIKRIKFIMEILKGKGITVLGYSADGDHREKKAMKYLSGLRSRFSLTNQSTHDEYYVPGFSAQILPEVICMQDTVHLVNTIKNRFFKTSILFPMGDFIATSAHLKLLFNGVTKVKHGLQTRDLALEDRMNFASTMRICDPKIWNLLDEHVPSSDGTRMYLKPVFFIAQSTLSTRLNCLERLYCLWYSLFFIRMWRKWLSTITDYSMVDNFITRQAYISLEINAHGLLNLVFYSLKQKSFQFFSPWLCSSQACEGFFRNLRSLTSTFCTIVNCTVLEALQRLKRIEMLADIMVFPFQKFLQVIHFPSTRFLNASNEKQDKVFDEIIKFDDEVSLAKIKEVIQRAKLAAFEDGKALGMNFRLESAEEVQQALESFTVEDECDSSDEEDLLRFECVNDTQCDSDDEDEAHELSNLTEDLSFAEVHFKIPEVTEDSSVAAVANSSGQIKLYKKSTLCWYYSTEGNRLSSDRLIRVKGRDDSDFKTKPNTVDGVQILERLCVNDYCLFYNAELSGCLLGLISYFGYMKDEEIKKGKKRLKWKDVQYKKDFVDRNTPSEKKIGVIASWFQVNPDRSLMPFRLSVQGAYDIAHYRFTVPKPVRIDKKF